MCCKNATFSILIEYQRVILNNREIRISGYLFFKFLQIVNKA